MLLMSPPKIKKKCRRVQPTASVWSLPDGTRVGLEQRPGDGFWGDWTDNGSPGCAAPTIFLQAKFTKRSGGPKPPAWNQALVLPERPHLMPSPPTDRSMARDAQR
ncbi:MAG: hypothetical protein ABI920_10720, partial [Casimicrobiaceae bacterium]